MEKKAMADAVMHQNRFVEWASKFCPEARLMNPKSWLLFDVCFV
jgi:hypothetical protein